MLEVTNIFLTRGNVLYRKCIYLQKKIKVLFSSTMLRYFVTAAIFHSFLTIVDFEQVNE